MSDDPKQQIPDSESNKSQNDEQPLKKKQNKRLRQMAEPRHFGAPGVEKKG